MCGSAKQLRSHLSENSYANFLYCFLCLPEYSDKVRVRVAEVNLLRKNNCVFELVSIHKFVYVTQHIRCCRTLLFLDYAVDNNSLASKMSLFVRCLFRVCYYDFAVSARVRSSLHGLSRMRLTHQWSCYENRKSLFRSLNALLNFYFNASKTTLRILSIGLMLHCFYYVQNFVRYCRISSRPNELWINTNSV